MYNKRNTYTKTIYWVGPLGILIMFLILVCLIIFFILRRKRTIQMSDDRHRYKMLLYEYNEENFQDKYSDAEADNYIKVFIFDETLFPQSVINADSATSSVSTWTNDSEMFGSLVKILHNLLGISLKKSSKHYHSKQIWERLDFAIREIAKKVPPWGDNWYQFAITYPLFLVCATFFREDVFNEEDLFLIRYLSSYIKKFFTPVENGFKDSYTYLRDGPNAVMMCVPYIGAHLLMNTYDYNDLGITYCRNYVDLKRVVSGDGIYDCDTFVFHKTLGPAFGYITSAMPDFKIISSFFDNPKTMARINRILEKTEHPTINLHFGPWFSRTGNLKGITNKGTFGFDTFDHMRAISVRLKNMLISFRGQMIDLCGYESDRANYFWFQTWVMLRMFLYKDSESELFKEFVTFYPGCFSYNNIRIELRSNTQTTETFMPIEASCVTCKLPKCVAMYNIYKFVISGYTFDVHELNLITENGGHFYYNNKVNENTHATNPLTLAVNFGHLEEEGSTTIGEMFKFKNAASFVYKGDGGIIIKSKIKHPKKIDVTYDAVQIQPHISAITRVLECGFSTMHNDRTSNECIKTPNIHSIETVRYTVYQPPDQPNLLYLYDNVKKQCAVSTDMGPIFKNIITLPRNSLQSVFKSSDYKIKDTILVNQNYTKTIPPGEKFQLLVENVSMSI